MKNACKILGYETNIEKPSKYDYYSSVYPFCSNKISKETKEMDLTIIELSM